MQTATVSASHWMVSEKFSFDADNKLMRGTDDCDPIGLLLEVALTKD